MDKYLGLEIADIDQRRQFLKDNCDKVQETGYMKQFSPDQVIQMKERLAQVSIEINDIEEEKKAANDVFKERLKPIVEEKHSLLTGIKHGSEFVEEICYLFVDQNEKMVGVYNDEGVLVSSRPATAKDMQGTIFQISRTGTND